ncbi:MAG: GerMN domain-containing protein, partial [Nocardioides sp.]
MNPHEDDQLRELLDNAVSDVEPRPGLDAIRSRTKVRSMPARPWFLGAAAAVVATAATITAFAVAGDGPGTTDADPGFADSPSTAGSPAGPTPEGPTPTSEPSSSDATQEPSPSVTDPGDPGDPGGLTAVSVYYVGETGQGPRLYREFHSAAADKRLATALRDAVAGPAVDPDYVTPWPAGTTVSAPTDGSVDGDQVDIEVNSPAGTSLHGRPAGMSAQ